MEAVRRYHVEIIDVISIAFLRIQKTQEPRHRVILDIFGCTDHILTFPIARNFSNTRDGTRGIHSESHPLARRAAIGIVVCKIVGRFTLNTHRSAVNHVVIRAFIVRIGAVESVRQPQELSRNVQIKVDDVVSLAGFQLRMVVDHRQVEIKQVVQRKAGA